MKRLSYLLILSLLVIATTTVRAQKKGDEQAVLLPLSQAPYKVGERLTYNVSFSSFINAAHVELFVSDRGVFFNREGIRLWSHIETTGIVNASLYAINNDYTTFVDPQTGRPYRSQRLVRQGDRTNDLVDEANVPLGTEAIPPTRMGGFAGTFDFLSALFRLRSLPLSDGAVYSFTARNETAQYDAELKVVGHQTVKTTVGSFNAIITQIRVPRDSHVNDMHIHIAFTDDERHVPVLITASLRTGELKADLAGSEFVNVDPAPTRVEDPLPRSRPPIANTPIVSPSPTPLAGLPFAVGEQLNYNVYLGTAPQVVATASFQIKSRGKYFNRDGLVLTTTAKTNGVVAKVFAANDQITSYVDPKTLLPFRTELQLQEGRSRRTEVLTIDQDRGNASTDKGKRMDIPVGTHDILSVLYALRAFNLNPPKRNAVSILVNDRPLTLFVTSLKREKIELNGQSIPAIQISLSTDDPQSDKYFLRLWIGDDKRKIPLRVTATTEIGVIRADLAIIPVNAQ